MKYEYKTVDLGLTGDTIAELNELGKHGWELCCKTFVDIYGKREYYQAEMKRVVK